MNNNSLKCPHSKKCSGCSLWNMDYAAQLSFKQAKAVKLLGSYCRIEKIIGMKSPFHYRAKVQAAFCTRHGEVTSGVYQSARRAIVPVDRCFLDNETADTVILAVRKLCKSFKIIPYDLRTGRGFLRHILVRKSFFGTGVMVVLVTARGDFRSARSFVSALLKLCPEITTVIRNINETDKGLFLGEKSEILYGDGYITERLLGLDFRISAKSFFQVNPVQTEILYQTALDYASLSGNETVVDAYCGTGTIGLIMAKNAREVIGAEIDKSAVADAVKNARLNNAENITFYNADSGSFMQELEKSGKKIDVAVTDPPRAGCGGKFLKSLISLSPERIVYISCNPETLSNDLYRLCRGGYRVKKIQPVDMFPYTEHVETVVLLSKLKSTHHIDVEIELDKMDLTKAESKATYAEIKQYVLDKYGLKVSQLNIAQVKRKHGLIERINYNVGGGKNRVPQVTPEKESAIEDALRHFQMIE